MSLIRTMDSDEIRPDGNVDKVERRNAYVIFVGKRFGKQSAATPEKKAAGLNETSCSATSETRTVVFSG